VHSRCYGYVEALKAEWLSTIWWTCKEEG
jgi:hypothetical protein